MRDSFVASTKKNTESNRHIEVDDPKHIGLKGSAKASCDLQISKPLENSTARACCGAPNTHTAQSKDFNTGTKLQSVPWAEWLGWWGGFGLSACFTAGCGSRSSNPNHVNQQ
nr:hypothetical protein Iba_chr10cCG11530 [Ipomoea batatas]GMD45797.1 hypothetical protein Iba_chr10dCG13520 [Ipomoea batatas]GMD48290.1 hypothetical protein Iba_scaffold1350493CG0010 [Ipomoea batatas]GME11849.1 hypothetical protein Iba_scaffold12719CG0010 [Ipomoea batatas]GME11850.1 hypothetical protein Iba_scaffold12720CG0010 [Ipomoea batatas]